MAGKIQAATNVVRLPTASPRQVKQFQTVRVARLALLCGRLSLGRAYMNMAQCAPNGWRLNAKRKYSWGSNRPRRY